MPVSTECAAVLLSFRYPSYIYLLVSTRAVISQLQKTRILASTVRARLVKYFLDPFPVMNDVDSVFLGRTLRPSQT